MPTVPPFETALSTVPLNELQRAVMEGRYIPLVTHLRNRTAQISFMFHTSRVIITVGSLIVPALLSIQGVSNTNVGIYWGTWIVSLFVTICNALLALFKFDKRYYYLHTVLEQMISEGWQYIELTGKYSIVHQPHTSSTHENQFVYFCHSVEKIRMRQVEEEYYKIAESQNQVSQGKPEMKAIALIPPTPQQGELSALPTEIIEAVKKQLSNTNVENGGGGSAERKGKKEDKADSENWKKESVSVSFPM